MSISTHKLDLSQFLYPEAVEQLKNLKISYSYLTGEHLQMWFRGPSIDTKSICGIDIETYPDPRYIGTFGTALLAPKSLIRTVQIYDGKEVVILDFMNPDGSNLFSDKAMRSHFCTLLMNGVWTAHNAQFEVNHFTKILEANRTPAMLSVYCTMNAYRLILQSNSFAWKQYDATLKGVSRRVLGVNIDKEIAHDRWAVPGPLDAEQLRYCALDAVLPKLLLETLHGNLAELGMVDFYKLNTKLHNPLAHMHLFGAPIDEPHHNKLIVEWKEKLAVAELDCFKLLNERKTFTIFELFKEVLLDKVAAKQKEKILELVEWFKGETITPLALKGLVENFAALSIENKEDRALRICFNRASENLRDYLVNPGSDKQLSEWVKAHVPLEDIYDWPLTEAHVNKLAHTFEQVEIKNYGDAVTRLQNLPETEEIKNLISKLQLSMSHDDLEDVNDLPIVEPILRFKKYSKLVSTYGEGLQDLYIRTPWNALPTLHTNYSLCFTETGRMSSFKPNLQNSVRDPEFRKIFCTRGPGYKMISADLAQVELRVFGEVSQDPVILRVYETGGDIHTETMASISGKSIEELEHLAEVSPVEHKELRVSAKCINFSTIYGGGPGAASRGARKAGIKKPIEDFISFIEGYRERYHVAREWQIQHAESCKHSKKVTMPYGKIGALHPEYVYTQSLNWPIQSGAFVIMGKLLVNLYQVYVDRPDLDFIILKVVHDSVDLDCREDQVEELTAILKDCAERAMLEVFPNASVLDLIDISSADHWGAV